MEIGRYRHFDVFVAVEMYLLVASDILRLTLEDFQFEESTACLYSTGFEFDILKSN